MKYSTIMPVYNAGDKLRKSIESILSQTYSNWELIIIDDGSIDNSLDICNEYSKKDSRIKVIHQDNHGPGYARNVGIKYAKGDYITFLDADDYYENTYYEDLFNEININSFDVIFFNRVMENDKGKINKINSVKKFKKCTKEELIKLQMMGILPWGPCLKIAKNEIIKKCVFSDLDVGEECIFSYEVIDNSNNIGFLDKTLYHYVYNENGQHTKGGIDPWRNVAIKLKQKLLQKGQLENYECAINALALRGLCIAIKRICCSNNYKNSKKLISKYIKEYEEEFNIYNTDKKLLDKTSKIIMRLIRLKLYFLIYIGTKIKY